ncbi:MAG: (d)CMP kinase [Phycisphaerae bacterium]|nr:(d)CMP kinase [Phycisphaerae bacterium]
MAKIIITIDGPAGSGKSTIASLVAQRLGVTFLDTGAMYRAVTLAAMQQDVNLADEEQLSNVLNQNAFEFVPQKDTIQVHLNDVDVTDSIRTPDVTANSKFIAASPKIREKLVKMQRDFASTRNGIVTEGRDQGTVAFPDADVKIFLTASLEERSRRRQNQPQNQGGGGQIEQIKETINHRDACDKNRSTGPLIPAEDAITLDTTNMNIEQVVETILQIVEEKNQC